MKRLDFLGVPGIGKTTTYTLLKELRQSRDEYLLSEEAYTKAIVSNFPVCLQFCD